MSGLFARQSFISYSSVMALLTFSIICVSFWTDAFTVVAFVRLETDCR